MPYCENCGSQVAEQAVACTNCGHPMRGLAPFTGKRQTEGTAIASLILGIAGFVICPVVPSILAIIFGNTAKRRIANDPSLEGDGLAKAGVVLGWVALALAVVGAIIFILAVIFVGDTTVYRVPVE